MVCIEQTKDLEDMKKKSRTPSRNWIAARVF